MLTDHPRRPPPLYRIRDDGLFLDHDHKPVSGHTRLSLPRLILTICHGQWPQTRQKNCLNSSGKGWRLRWYLEIVTEREGWFSMTVAAIKGRTVLPWQFRPLVHDLHVSGIAEYPVALAGSQFPDTAQTLKTGECLIDRCRSDARFFTSQPEVVMGRSSMAR